MTGTLDVVTEDPPYLRLALDLDSGETIAFADRRHLGEARIVNDAGCELRGIGPEPFDDVDPAVLRAGERPIKAVLMDQSVLAGVGNIYADESLFRARIHPLTPAATLDDKDATRLLKAVRSVLEKSIADLEREYPIRWRYLDDGPSPFLVYDRAGDRCKRCRNTLTSLRVAGRNTVICPTCQRLSSPASRGSSPQRKGPRTRRR